VKVGDLVATDFEDLGLAIIIRAPHKKVGDHIYVEVFLVDPEHDAFYPGYIMAMLAENCKVIG